MNYDNKPCISPFTFKLEDCLACSSCISDFTIRKNYSYAELKKEPLNIIISPHSKMNMFSNYKRQDMTFDTFEYLLVSFIKLKFSIIKIYDTSYIKNLLYNQVYKESTKKKLIISDCPGTVSYIEKQAHHLVEYLSVTQTQQQAVISLAKGKTLSVVQCYDKMMETTSDVITTFDFYKILIEIGFLEYSTDIKKVEDWEKCFISHHYGYLVYILSKRHSLDSKLVKNDVSGVMPILNNDKPKDIKINGKRQLIFDSLLLNKINIPGLECTSKNGMFIYTRTIDNKITKYIRILGLEPFLNFIKETKIHGLQYDICEIYICNQGCINGPGQVYTDSIYINNIDLNLKEENFEDLDLQTRQFTKIKSKTVNFKIDW